MTFSNPLNYLSRRLYAALLLTAFALSPAYAQMLNPVSPSTLSFYSFSPVTQPTPPVGTQFLLQFPNQTVGSQWTRPACSTYSALQYNHFTFSGGVWTGPVTGPVFAYFSTFDASTNPSGNWAGISANISMTGSVATNTSPSTQNFIQSFFFSTDACYEYGPEYGFYRLLVNPGDPTEEGTIVFYYGMNVNCFNADGLGSCRDKSTGASLQYNVVTQNITGLPSTNSAGGKNWVFQAYVNHPNNFHVAVLDPFTSTVVQSADVAIDTSGFFAATAQQMLTTTGLNGYFTVTQQRNSAQGNLTENGGSPLDTTVYGISQVVSQNIPTPVTNGPPYSAVNGNCMDGAGTINVLGYTSSTSTLVMRSYPTCTITVYLAGTSTPATLYSDSTGTSLANPFTANSHGRYQFYASNGSYDVRLSGGSGGGISTPLVIGGIPLFNGDSYRPHDVFAYPFVDSNPADNTPGIIGVYEKTATYYGGFTVNNPAQNNVWILPDADAVGCLSSNGLFQLGFVGCSAAGPTGAVQYNNGGNFAGDSNFLWDRTAQDLSVAGKSGTEALRVSDGYIFSTGGLFTQVGSWQAFNTNTDGALLRGLHLDHNVAGTAGGYINLAPLIYDNQPAPLPGLSAFGAHTALIWVSGLNTMSPDTTYGLNTNLYINAAGGLKTDNTPFNSIQAQGGGMFAKSFTAINYIQAGNSAGPPPLTTFDSFNPGALYYDTAADVMKVMNNAHAWVDIGTGGGGGGGTPGGPNTSIQFNNSGSFGGSFNLYWNNSTQLLTVNATGAGAAGIDVVTGYMQADAGFLATPGTATAYNSIQTPTGGLAGLSVTVSKYIQSGNGSVDPTPTGSDSFHAGALYYSTTNNCEMVHNGTSFGCIAGGGGGSPGGANTNVQFNNTGAFGGSGHFYWNNSGQLLTVDALDSAHAGMVVSLGYVQADAGFLATALTATNYNAIQAPGGGLAGLSLTVTGYVQTGNSSATPTLTTGDTFHAGALYYDTTNACEELYNGTAWACLGTGGGGTPGGANTNVQFNNSGAFGGSGNFTWNNATHLLTVTATGSGAAGIAVGTGFIQADAGFLATVGTATNYNAIQAPGGGLAGLSVTATNYVQSGNHSGAPTPTTSDTFHAGALYWDTVALCEEVYNGSSWSCIGGGGGSPGGSNTSVQYNDSGSFGGDANFTWNKTTQILTATNGMVSKVFNSTATGSTIGFQLSNSNFSLDGNGNVSMAGSVNSVGGAYKINGTTVIDGGRAASFRTITQQDLSAATWGASFQNNTATFPTVIIAANGSTGGELDVTNTSGGFSANFHNNGSGTGMAITNGSSAAYALQLNSSAGGVALNITGKVGQWAEIITSSGMGIQDNSASGSTFSIANVIGDLNVYKHIIGHSGSPSTPTGGCSMVSGSTDVAGAVACPATTGGITLVFSSAYGSTPFCTASVVDSAGNLGRAAMIYTGVSGASSVVIETDHVGTVGYTCVGH
jgi:hypothetical protein